MSLVVAALATAAVLVWPSLAAITASASAGVLPPPRGAPEAVPVVEIASVMELLALVLQSGAGVLEALETVGRRLDDVCGEHLLTVAAALRWGLPEQDAWAAVPPAWTPVASALVLANAAGVPPAELLVNGADDLRRADRHRLELATARLGVRVVLPLGLTFLPGFVLTTVVPVVIALTSDVLGG